MQRLVPQKTKPRFYLVLSALLFIQVMLCLFSLYKWNHQSSNFWFDETGQYWISQGLNHFSKPLQPKQDYIALWQQNRKNSIDPGGFTVLLRAWTDVFGSSPQALRSAPFLFFLLTLLSAGLLFKRIFKHTAWALISVLFVFLYPKVLYYAFELRPYMMEFCGVMFSFLALEKLGEKKSSPKNWDLSTLLLCIALSAFCFSRYSFPVLLASLCISFVAVEFLNNQRTKGSKQKIVMLCASSLVFASLAYLLSLRYQSSSAEPPDYVQSTMFYRKNLSQIFELLQVNFFSLKGLPITLFLVAAPIFKKNIRIWAYVLTSVIVFLFLSILGKTPFHIEARWSLFLQAFSIVCSMILASWLLEWGTSLLEKKSKWDLTFIFFTVFGLGFGNYVLSSVRAFHREYSTCTTDVLMQAPAKPMLVHSSEYPNVRYQFEHGSLYGYQHHTLRYPALFSLLDSETKSSAQKFDYFLSNGLETQDLQKISQQYGLVFQLEKQVCGTQLFRIAH